MKIISLDYETFSVPDLKKTGVYKYVAHKDFDVLCFAYSIDFKSPKLWKPGDDIPHDFKFAMQEPGVKIYAFNANFERLVTQRSIKLLGLKKKPDTARYRDTQAIARHYGYPSTSLMKLCEILQVGNPKDKIGESLMKKPGLVKPRKPTRQKPWTRLTPDIDPETFELLYKYCLQDVRAEQDVLKAMPSLDMSDFENAVWAHTALQNDRGLPLDIPLINQVLKVKDEWLVEAEAELKKYTNGFIETGNQRDRFLQLLEKANFPLPDLKAETIEDCLMSSKTPPKVKKLLKFRQDMSKNSVAKFNKGLMQANGDGRCRGTFTSHATITGRLAGRGFQLHNLPRKKEDVPRDLIDAFFQGLGGVQKFANKNESVMDLAKKLIRPSIKAPEGYLIYAGDYSSIENVITSWYAQDTNTLDDFKKGLKQYRVFGSKFYGIGYDDLSDKQYHHSKTMILGLGFGMSWKTHQAAAEKKGIVLTDEDAQRDVKFYRSYYSQTPALWYAFYQAAEDAVKHRIITKHRGVLFGVKNNQLLIRLPSGHILFYNEPKIKMERMPWGQDKHAISFMGHHPKVKTYSRLVISPGRLTENIVQATAGDVLKSAALRVEKAGYPVIGSVHDEILCLVKNETLPIDDMFRIMEKRDSWMNGYDGFDYPLPLRVEGFSTTRYKKG